MASSNRRKASRSRAWQDTKASIKAFGSRDFDSRKIYKTKGHVEDIGSDGMFIKSNDFIPVAAEADIVINFDSENDPNACSVKASGETVRVTDDGVGVKFNSIDLSKLQKCIIRKINQK